MYKKKLHYVIMLCRIDFIIAVEKAVRKGFLSWEKKIQVS